MRPFGLLLAASLCTVLLYDRLAGRFPTTVLAAAPAPAAQLSPHHETRSETLQRCLAASQLIDLELARYRELRAVEVADLVKIVKATFRKNLNKALQETCDRVFDETAASVWDDQHRDAFAQLTREYHDREMLTELYKFYRGSLCDPRTDAAKALRKEFESHALEKEARVYEERILLFDRDREAALAALK